MSKRTNELLAELKRAGLTDGVVTTVDGSGTSVSAGDLVARVGGTDEAAFTEVLQQLLDEITALPADERPKAWESTTRTTASHTPNANEDRPIRKLSEEDFA